MPSIRILRSIPATRSRFFILANIGREPGNRAGEGRQIIRRLAVIWLFGLVLVGIFPPNLFSQTEIKITGQVVDQISGAPVPGAIIAIQGRNRNAVSDANGQFYFSDLPAGDYHITAERIGYKKSSGKTIYVDDFAASQIVFTMKPEVIVVAGQTVVASKTAPILIHTEGNITEVDLMQGSLNSIDLLAEKIPELELVNSGPRKLIRIRGGQTNGTIIMLDGRVVNSTLNSEGDVSAIPLKSVSKIEIIKGGSHKSEGLAGSVNFITESDYEGNTFFTSGERGSYGLESYSIQYSHKRAGGILTGISLDNTYEKGNFKFADPRDSIEIRENNFTRNFNIFGKFGYSNSTMNINLNGHYFRRNSGVPGPIFQYTPEAKASSEEKEIYSNLEKALNHGLKLNMIAGITNRDATYDSPVTPTNFIQYKTNFLESSRDIKLKLSHMGKIDFDSYFGLRYEALNGKDLVRPSYSFGKQSRMTNSLAAGAVYHFADFLYLGRNSAFTLGIRKDGGQKGDFWAPSGSIRINFDLPFKPGLDVSAYRSRRLPDLTDLYWKEDVFATPNIDLQPEKSMGYELGSDVQIEAHGEYRLRMSRYSTRYDDIIIWRRWAGDKFKPVNLSKAAISGWEISLEASPFSGPVTLFWNASFIRPLNKEPGQTHYDKYLTFRPIGSQSAVIELNYRSVNLKLHGRHIGRRYITEENTKLLSPVDLLDLSSGYKIKIWSFYLAPSFSILNIGNIQYEILDGQPEKPREYRFGIELSKDGGVL